MLVPLPKPDKSTLRKVTDILFTYSGPPNLAMEPTLDTSLISKSSAAYPEVVRPLSALEKVWFLFGQPFGWVIPVVDRDNANTGKTPASFQKTLLEVADHLLPG